MADWVVAVARHQRGALCDLVDAGFSCYQPRFREKIIRRGAAVWVERLLLEPYILVRFLFDWSHGFQRLMGLRTISDVLRSDTEPMIALDSEVTRMMGSEVRGYVPAKRLAPARGSGGRVLDGPFAYHNGLFQERDDERCVDSVLVSLLGRWNKIEVSLGSWEPA